MSRSTFLLLSDFERLEEWCRKRPRLVSGEHVRTVRIEIVGRRERMRAARSA